MKGDCGQPSPQRLGSAANVRVGASVLGSVSGVVVVPAVRKVEFGDPVSRSAFGSEFFGRPLDNDSSPRACRMFVCVCRLSVVCFEFLACEKGLRVDVPSLGLQGVLHLATHSVSDKSTFGRFPRACLASGFSTPRLGRSPFAIFYSLGFSRSYWEIVTETCGANKDGTSSPRSGWRCPASLMSGEEARAYSRQLAFFGLIRVLTFVGRESPAACLASPWLAMSIVDLEAQLGELQGRLSTAKTRVATAKRQLNSECPRRCTPWMRSVAVKLLALSNHDDAVVAKYLAARGRVEQPADVRDWHDSLPLADLPGLLVRQGDPGVLRQLAEAEKFLHEFRLVSWVQEQNEKKGIAPTASAVLDEAGPGLARQKWMPNRYRWLQQCMRRWGGRRVRFSGGSDELSHDEFVRKVAVARLCRRVLG